MISSVGSFTAAQAVGSQMRESFSQQGVDGILIRLDDEVDVDAMTLNVVLHTKDGSEVLVAAMPVQPLFERSDFVGGSSWSAAYARGQAIDANAADDSTAEVAQVSALVSLGHIELSGDDELEVTLVVTVQTVGAVDVGILDLGPGTEEILRVLEKPTGVANFGFPKEVYAYRTAADANEDIVAEGANAALNINTKIGDRAYSYGQRLAYAATQAMGKFESNGPRRLLFLYGEGHVRNVGGGVSVTLTGTDRANWSTFALERVLLPARAERQAVRLQAGTRASLSKAMASAPAEVRALRAAGKV